jgi:N-acetylmuramoyl-L-alanine amidase
MNRQRPTPPWLRAVWAALALACLSGCTAPGGLAVDSSHPAQGQDSRVQFLVLHFTAESLADSLHILTKQAVSSHYLVTDEPTPRILQLVPEERRAWHAGESFWRGQTGLNASSIGIEIVNLGGRAGPDGRKTYTPYPPSQMDLVLALVEDIVRRHGIRPERVVGHSDIAPQRKDDPGPLFPWARFGKRGLIPWPDAARVAKERALFEAASPPGVAWFQSALATVGYRVPTHGELDGATRRVLAAFQMRYRPANFEGHPDTETAALLQVLITPAAK